MEVGQGFERSGLSVLEMQGILSHSRLSSVVFQVLFSSLRAL
ncbi:hypothetical protein [Psychrobacter coccoides]|nr:hypothetical protein [Psychrobacter coccoides]